MITEPRWRSFIVETTKPIFTPKQCQMIIDAGRNEPKQDAGVVNDKGINQELEKATIKDHPLINGQNPIRDHTWKKEKGIIKHELHD